MSQHRSLARSVQALLLLAAFLSQSSAAQVKPTSKQKQSLVVFGDSLSDTGNAFKLNKKQYPDTKWYSNGRYCNGPVWPQYVASWRSMRLNVRAYSGAGACEDGSQPDYVGGYATVPSLKQQVDSYLQRASKAAIANNIHVLYAGVNDYLSFWSKDTYGIINAATAPKPQPAVVVSCIITASSALLTQGARKVVVFNLHDLTLSPMVLTNSTLKATLHQQVLQHNALLANAVKGLRQRFKRAKCLLFNMHAVHLQVTKKPPAYGLSVVTDSALTGYVQVPNFPYWTPTKVHASSQYMYWDGLHFTTHMQKIIAQYVDKMLVKATLV